MTTLLTDLIEDFVVAHGAQAELPVRGAAWIRIAADQRDQLDARPCAQVEALGARPEQHDRALDFLAGARDLRGQLGDDDRLCLLRHNPQFSAAGISMQAVRARRCAVPCRGAPQSAGDRATIACCTGSRRSSWWPKQFDDRALCGADRPDFQAKTGGFYGLCAKDVEFLRTPPLNRPRVPEGGASEQITQVH